MSTIYVSSEVDSTEIENTMLPSLEESQVPVISSFLTIPSRLALTMNLPVLMLLVSCLDYF
jgi:hypothetical protein